MADGSKLPSMQKPFLIFDFDGTIADTLGVVEEIINEIGGEFGLPRLSSEKLNEIKSKKASDLIKLSGLAWWDLPAFLKRAKRAFRDRISEVEPIRGMPEAIRHLNEQGYRMGILTSNSEENVRIFLKNHDINCFEFVQAPQSIFGKAGVLKSILKKYDLKPTQALMLGDEERDIKAAKKCKVPVLAVSWGFNSVGLLKEQHPQFFAYTPEELVATIETINFG